MRRQVQPILPEGLNHHADGVRDPVDADREDSLCKGGMLVLLSSAPVVNDPLFAICLLDQESWDNSPSPRAEPGIELISRDQWFTEALLYLLLGDAVDRVGTLGRRGLQEFLACLYCFLAQEVLQVCEKLMKN